MTGENLGIFQHGPEQIQINIEANGFSMVLAVTDYD